MGTLKRTHIGIHAPNGCEWKNDGGRISIYIPNRFWECEIEDSKHSWSRIVHGYGIKGFAEMVEHIGGICFTLNRMTDEQFTEHINKLVCKIFYGEVDENKRTAMERCKIAPQEIK